jgi:type II secretory pathway pseudopilin PulG
MNIKRGRFKLGQIWIETVVYMLIGLALIGILLSIALPRINQMKDRALIEQSIDFLNILDSKFNEVLSSAGNTRQINLGIKKGNFVIDSWNNSIYFFFKDSSYMLSEIGETTKNGEINMLTINNGKNYDIYLALNYSSFNITYNNQKVLKEFTSSSAAYNLLIENRGGADKKINFKSI